MMEAQSSGRRTRPKGHLRPRAQSHPPPLIAEVQELLNTRCTDRAIALLHAHRDEYGGTFLWHRSLALAYAREHREKDARREVTAALTLCPHDTLTKSIYHSLESVYASPERALEFVVSHVWHATGDFPEARLTKRQNAGLRRRILANETLDWQADGFDQPLHNGWQTDDVHSGMDLGYRSIEKAIGAATRALLATKPQVAMEMGVASDCSFSLKLWSVVVPPTGFVAPHTHPFADISGVYYVDIPDEIGGGDGGALKFVTHAPEMAPPDRGAAPEHLFRPQTGAMVMFPSHLWHCTVPFAPDVLRIGVAFDVTFERD